MYNWQSSYHHWDSCLCVSFWGLQHSASFTWYVSCFGATLTPKTDRRPSRCSCRVRSTAQRSVFVAWDTGENWPSNCTGACGGAGHGGCCCCRRHRGWWYSVGHLFCCWLPPDVYSQDTPWKHLALKNLKMYSGQVKLSTTTSNFIYFIMLPKFWSVLPQLGKTIQSKPLCVFNPPKKKCLPCFCPGGFQPNLCRLRCWDDVWKRFVFFRTSAELKDWPVWERLEVIGNIL